MILAEGLKRRDTLLTADPPGHTRYKRVAMQALARRSFAYFCINHSSRLRDVTP